MEKPLRILVIGIARIGDTLLLTPVFQAIKENLPNTHLTVIAHPNRCSVLENLPSIDTLWGTTKNWLVWQGWLGGKTYDVALVYGRDLKLLKYAQRVSHKIYCFDEKIFQTITDESVHKVPLPKIPIHAVHERLLLIQAWLRANSMPQRLSYMVTEAEKQKAQQWLQNAGLASTHPLIGLQTNSFPTKSHRDWPASHFKALIRALLTTFPKAHFLILGDALAAEKGKTYLADFPDNVSIAAGQMSLRQSAALMSQLDLYVGVDTGPTHLAGALGIPMVAMYHPRYPGQYLMPLDNPTCRVVEHPRFVANKHRDDAMSSIQPGEVKNSAIMLLKYNLREQS